MSLFTRCTRVVTSSFNYRASILSIPRRYCQSTILQQSNTDSNNKIIGTHDGSFHCDEVLACYLLQSHTVQYLNARIIRSRNASILSTAHILVDVGLEFNIKENKFDHHQSSFNLKFMNTASTHMSSAGLIYKCFGYEIIRHVISQQISTDFVMDDEMMEFIHEKMYVKFIEEIDAIDNGISAIDSHMPIKYRISTTLANRVSHMNPSWNEPYSDEIAMEKFKKAMVMVGNEFVERLTALVKSWIPAQNIVRRSIEQRFEIDDSGFIFKLDEFCPWIEHLFDIQQEKGIVPFPLYVLFQERNHTWRIRAIPKSVTSFECIQPLPEHWRGKANGELCDITGIDGCLFVHQSGFIGGNETMKGALQMFRQSINSGVK